MKTLIVMLFVATLSAQMIKVEIPLSDETKKEIAAKAIPEIKQMFSELKCAEADLFLGLNPDTLDLQIFISCAEPAEPLKKAETKPEAN